MGKKVLIVFASKYGSTKEIAEKIGEVLKEEGLEAELADAKDKPGLGGYDAVVLGSGAYIGGWLKPAKAFLLGNAEALKDVKLWLFTSGPTEEGEPKELMDGRIMPPKLLTAAEEIGYEDLAVFHGYNNIEKMNSFDKWILKKVKAQAGDFRNWEMIASWARGIALALKE